MRESQLTIEDRRDGGAHVMIRATVDGEPVDFVLDTGAFESTVPWSFAHRHGLSMSPDPSRRLIDAHGKAIAFTEARSVPVLFEGETSPARLDFLVADGPPLLAPQSLVRRGWALVIDLRGKALRYQREDDALRQLRADPATPVRELDYHRCLLEGLLENGHRVVDTIVNGSEVPMLIDTGADHTVLFRNSPALKTMADKRGRITQVAALNSVGRMLFVEDVPIDFAGAKFVTALLVEPARSLCGQGVVGVDLLRQCTLVWGSNSLWAACRPTAPIGAPRP